MTMLLAFILSFLGLGPSGLATVPNGEERNAEKGVTILLPPLTQTASSLPTITAARGENPPLIVIDPGHGGQDPGAVSPFEGVREKDLTLALALTIRDELAASGRVRTALTRDDDSYLLLQERYEIARKLGADLFISIHADAAPQNDDAHGATVYTLSEVASDRQAALLAQRENEADMGVGARFSPNPDVNAILTDLAQRESMNVSAEFARILHREAAPLFAFRPNWHRFAAFIVLKAPDVPSVLFESGYLTNEADVTAMRSPEGRAKIAAGVRRAIEAHFSRRFLAPEA